MKLIKLKRATKILKLTNQSLSLSEKARLAVRGSYLRINLLTKQIRLLKDEK